MDKPIFIVKLKGMHRAAEIEAWKSKLKEQLDGTVIVIDEQIEYIEQLNPADKSRLLSLLESELKGVNDAE